MALVDSYLADRHVEAPEQGLGCALAAAGSEVPRQNDEVRRAVSRRIKDLIGLVERQFPDWGKNAAHEKAMAIVASMVGALLLARAVGDPQLSKAFARPRASSPQRGRTDFFRTIYDSRYGDIT